MEPVMPGRFPAVECENSRKVLPFEEAHPRPVDVEKTGPGRMIWVVFTDTVAGPGFLAGDYVGRLLSCRGHNTATVRKQGDLIAIVDAARATASAAI
jgi:hypothetical protein